MLKIIKNIKVYRLLELVFFIGSGLYLLFLAEKNTTFKFEYSIDVEKYLLNTLSFVVVIKLIIFLWDIWGDVARKKETIVKVIIFISSAFVLRIIYHMVYQEDKYKFLVFLGVLTLGTIGSDYRKILKVYVISVGLMTGAAILASLCGCIVNYAYLKEGGVIHSSWGIVHSTDYSSIILFLCMIAWIAWDNIAPIALFIPGLLSLLNSLFIARSITSTIIGSLFLVAVIFEGLDLKTWKKYVALLLEIAFPLCAFITVVFTYLYYKGTSVGIKLNTIFHERFVLLNNGIHNYKLSLFGTPFSQIGGGGTTFNNSNYNFIDSSYGLMLLRYGVVLFVAIMIFWVLMTKKAVKMGHMRLAFGLGLIAFHSFSEHHFTEVNYNIFIILPFSILGMGWLVKDKEYCETFSEKKVLSDGRLLIGALSVGVVAVFILLGGPYILSILRTVFDVTADVEIKHKEKLVCVFFGVVIITIIATVIALNKLLSIFYSKVKNRGTSIKRKIYFPLGVLLLAVLGLLLGVFACKRIIDKKSKPYIEVIDVERTAINAVKEGIKSSGGSFYADVIPYIYQKNYSCVTNDFIQGDELAERKYVTVLMDVNYDSKALFGMGFLYTEISDEHALYSNDESVIKKLEAVGYHMTGYYSRKRKVDLKAEAERNELSMTGNGSVIIGENGKALRYGPYYELRSGHYTVTYNLSLPEVDTYEKDYKVCTLLICVNWGTRIAEIPVYRRDFDSEGVFLSETLVDISENRGCEFKVYPENGRMVLVSGISCQKTPDIDVHNTYDEKGRVIRSEYYDIDGNPIDTNDGYHAVEYKYNSENQVSFYHYYDVEGKSVITSFGYAAKKCKYDVKGRGIKETYYDVDGSKLIMAKGYSSVGFGYDDKNNGVEFRYYDENDIPVMISNGYSIYRRVFDDDKRIILEEYFDTADKPVLVNGGYAKIAYDYNEANQETCRRYYGEDGKLRIADVGYAQLTKIFDDTGKLIREDYYGSNGERVTIAGGYAIVEYKYDLYSNPTDIYYYNEFEKPALCGNSYHHVHRDYNASGQIIKETYYDLLNNAIVLPEGYTTVEMQYDKAGNVIAYRYLDERGFPVMRINGYAEVNYAYNEKNKVIKATYMDEFGEPVILPDGYSIAEFSYDENGNRAYESYYDANGNPVAWWGLFYKKHRIFNKQEQIVREEYLDESGRLMMRTDNYAAIEREYDACGNLIEQRYLDIFGNLSLNTSGYAVIHREYDSEKHIIKECYLGLKAELVDCEKGYATIEYSYGGDGNLVNTIYYKSNGEVVE